MSNSRTITASSIRTEIERCRVGNLATDFKVDGEPGLWLRVSPKGVAAWSLVYRPKGHGGVQRYGLGRYPSVSVKDARDMARVWMAEVAKGIDPREVRRNDIEAKRARQEKAEADANAKAARLTVSQAIEAFALAKRDRRSVRQMRQMLETNLGAVHGDRALADLTRSHVEAIHEAIIGKGAPRHADNVMSTVRSMLSWAVKKRHVTENVAARFERAMRDGEGARERRLSASEVRALWLSLDDDNIGLSVPVRRIVRLALLLGPRANEVASMRRSELSADNGVWTVPADRMKAGKAHVVPLPPMARAIVADALAEAEGPYLFAVRQGKPPKSSSLAHSMQRLNARLKFKDAEGRPDPVKMHDFRRTISKGLQHLGVTEDVIKAVLAHTDSGDVTRTHYAQGTPIERVREALTRWQGAVAQMVRGEDPFAVRAEDVAEMERRILGSDMMLPAKAASPSNVVRLRASG